MTPAEKYENYLLNAPVAEHHIEVFEFSHSSFGSEYICNEPAGLTVTLDTDEEVFVTGRNIEVERSEDEDNLEESFTVTTSDQSSEIQRLINKISIDDDEKILMKYRIFMSDELEEQAIETIITEVINVAFKESSVTFTCKVPSAVSTRSGELYTYERFPGLLAYL